MAEPEDFSARDRSHIPLDLWREPASYQYPVRDQVRKPLRDDYTGRATALLAQLTTALGSIPVRPPARRVWRKRAPDTATRKLTKERRRLLRDKLRPLQIFLFGTEV